MPQSPLIIRGARLPEGDGLSSLSDITIIGGRIATITPASTRPPDACSIIDANGRVCLPGLVDAHCHAQAAIFHPDVQLALLRQGVTTVIAGQDGIGAAPSNQGSFQWSANYFAGLDGASARLHPGSVAQWLTTYDHATPVNVAVCVPHGSLRYLVAGAAQRPSTPDEISQMAHLLEVALAEGAVGLSTGLEYAPATWADARELETLLYVVASHQRVHASHMRGYEAAAPDAVAELISLAIATGVATHIAHYHGDAATLGTLLDQAAAAGAPMTFDSYAYTRGCSLLAMLALPHWLSLADAPAALAELDDAGQQPRLEAHMAALDDLWPRVTMAWVHGTDPATGAPLDWTQGLTLPQIALRLATSQSNAALRLLQATSLRATCVFQQPASDSPQAVSALANRGEHMAGSDAVYVPFGDGHPHPRGWGAMARWLALKVVDEKAWTWRAAADHLSARAVRRFGLGDRGVLQPGAVADLALIEPAELRDQATYDVPRALATGIDDVLVAGVPVLTHGQLTNLTPGMGLRWTRDTLNNLSMTKESQ